PVCLVPVMFLIGMSTNSAAKSLEVTWEQPEKYLKVRMDCLPLIRCPFQTQKCLLRVTVLQSCVSPSSTST
ncbi:hypothetical protein EV401DRAFT_1922870, partial [Pisolithus croceorrhizus]